MHDPTGRTSGRRWPSAARPVGSAVAAACHPHGALVFASLDHAGGQGPPPTASPRCGLRRGSPEVNTREMPKWMEAADIDAVVAGFAAAAAAGHDAGCDGVEINAGQHSLVRQFLSGLTNQRDDEWGTDRLAFAREVIAAVRAAAGAARRRAAPVVRRAGAVGRDHARHGARHRRRAWPARDRLPGRARGSIFSAEKTRPDFHEPTGFNVDVCRTVRAAVDVPVILQGSIVDVGQAEWALGGYDDPASATAWR